MKKISLFMVLLLALGLVPVAVLAQGDPAATETPATTDVVTPTPTPPQDTTAPEGSEFVVDNQNVYEGMNKAYQQGYTPTVKGGKAIVILPLQATGTIRDNSLVAVPNLGATAGSPFAFQNIQLTVTKKDYSVNGGKKTVPAYLVHLELPLVSGRLNGVYPVQIDVQAKASDGTPIQQSFTAYVTIKDGKDPNATPAPQTTPPPAPQPKVLISSYAVQPNPVQAGEEFAATVTLENTNEDRAVQNMTVTVSTDSPNLALLNESNAFFIKKLGAGDTVDLTLKFRSDLGTPPQRYTVTLNIEYDNKEAVTLTGTGSFPVQVGQPLRVDMDAPELTPTVNVGDTFPLSLQVMNLGRGAVYNVRCEVNVPGLVPSGAAFIGNMEAGTAVAQKVDILVGTKDMGASGGTGKYGLTQGTVKLVYEDSDGKEYTKDFPVSTTIQESAIASAPEQQEEEKPKLIGQWWISAAIGAVILAALVVFLLVRRRQRGAA